MCPEPGRGGPFWPESPTESLLGEILGKKKTALGLARMKQLTTGELCPDKLWLEFRGAEQSGAKAIRSSLGHACTIASSPNGAGGMRENHRDSGSIPWRQTDLPLPNLHHYFWVRSNLHFPGLSPCLDRMSAHIHMAWNVECPQREPSALSPDMRLLTCCLSIPTYGNPSVTLLCAKRDVGLPRFPLGDCPGSLPNP